MVLETHTRDAARVAAAVETGTDAHSIQAGVIAALQDLVRDWEPDAPLTAETRLVADLEFEFIDVIQMVVALEQRFGRRNLGFDRLLMAGGRYVDDLRVADIVRLLEQRLEPAEAASGAAAVAG